MNSKPKRALFASAALVLTLGCIAAVFFVSRAEQGSSRATSGETLYTCGMHPQVIQNKPGLCPICGMKLTPIRKQADAGPAEHKVKHYKSTMIPGEISPTPKKDSMGMEMVPVYEQ